MAKSFGNAASQGLQQFNNAFYWTVGEVGRAAQMLDQAQMSITGVPLDAIPMGRIEAGGAAALVAIGAWGVRAEEVAAVVAKVAPKAYSVAFESRLAQTELGFSQGRHFQIANQALQAERAVNPTLGAVHK